MPLNIDDFFLPVGLPTTSSHSQSQRRGSNTQRHQFASKPVNSGLFASMTSSSEPPKFLVTGCHRGRLHRNSDTSLARSTLNIDDCNSIQNRRLSFDSRTLSGIQFCSAERRPSEQSTSSRNAGMSAKDRFDYVYEMYLTLIDSKFIHSLKKSIDYRQVQ